MPLVERWREMVWFGVPEGSLGETCSRHVVESVTRVAFSTGDVGRNDSNGDVGRNDFRVA